MNAPEGSVASRRVVTLGLVRSSMGGGRSGRVSTVERAEIFEAERPRLLRVAARGLDDRAEAEDVAQQAWLRPNRTDTDIPSRPA